ncbi:adhesion G protein-coupled receptor L3-like, partial [Lethenteron reissneri]|uniref:adhesion G protein-coupled receptor L3-like n=1 Tax=Lethenteron reissneri TaxID=7753 RepID=UPI002AB7A2A5
MASWRLLQAQLLLLLLGASGWPRATGSESPVRRELSCEGRPVDLRCPGSYVIAVSSAFYGRTDGQICESEAAKMQNTACLQVESFHIVARRCNNRTWCHVVAGNELFADPCPGTYKYLEVWYKCVPYSEYLRIFPCPGSIRLVGEALHLLQAKQKAGSWCRDPLRADGKVYFMPWSPHRTKRLVEYTSLQDMAAGLPLTNYQLPHRVDGTGFVVYDGAVFFNKERTRRIVKFDLGTRVKSGEAVVPNANYYDTSPYRWGGRSDMDLAADENGLWVIYATEQNEGRVVVSRLNPYTLRIEASFETAYDKRSASDAFMACGVLYVLRSTYEDDGDGGANGTGGGGGEGGTSDRIDYVYDTNSRRDARVAIPFPNPFQFIASVQYNPRDGALYVWDNHHVLRYTLHFGTRDPTAVHEISTIGPSSGGSTASPPRSHVAMVPPIPTQLPQDTTDVTPGDVAPADGGQGSTSVPTSCPPTLAHAVQWPQLLRGKTAERPCPAGAVGTALYTCDAITGAWSARGPDLSNCTSTWVNQIAQWTSDHFSRSCCFWNCSSHTTRGDWWSYGCDSTHTDSTTHTTCSCSHLNNFAVLMARSDVEYGHRAHELLLLVITWAGVLVSLVCLAVATFTFCFFSGLQSDRNTVHKNLCLSLLLAQLLFLVGINKTQYTVACSVLAALLHLLFLAAFAWMFLEGLQLYLMLVEVFEGRRSRRKCFYLLGYGLPLALVAASLAVDYTGYGTERACWLRTDNHFIWSFLAPVATIILVNSVFLLMTVYKMVQHSAPLTLENIKSCALGVVALLCLLGVTWAFGFLLVDKATLVMAYLFTIFNSFQGTFIFIFHCALQKKVLKEYNKCVGHAEWCGCWGNNFSYASLQRQTLLSQRA